MESHEINVAIVEMFMEGATYREMAEILGVCIGAVSNRVKRMRDAGVHLPSRDPARAMDADSVVKLNAVIANTHSKQV